MARPDHCPNCGNGDVSRHTGSYCEECGEPLTKAEISREHSVAVNTRKVEAALTIFALEFIYMDGCADQVSGDVEAPTGHFYRVGRQIVDTDSRGFHNYNSYTTEAEAEAEFDRLDNLYSEWLGDDDEN